MTTRRVCWALSVASLLALGGCAENEAEITPETPRVGSPGSASLDDWVPNDRRVPAHPDPASGPAIDPNDPPPPNAVPGVSGTVRETMQAAGYDYMRVETEDGDVWVAAMGAQVEVGDHVRTNGVLMVNFRSNALDRTFERIVLASNVQHLDEDGNPIGGAAGGTPNPHGGAAGGMPNPHAGGGMPNPHGGGAMPSFHGGGGGAASPPGGGGAPAPGGPGTPGHP